MMSQPSPTRTTPDRTAPDQTAPDQTTHPPNAARPISTISLSLLVVASMIGAGVYTTSGFAMADLRDPSVVLAAWAVGGVIAICGAVSFGQLTQHVTDNGGEYLYLSRQLHPAAGFLAGWVSMLAGFTGAAAFAALAMESYATPLLPASIDLPPGTLAIVVVLVATTMHCFRTEPGVWFQNTLVTAKLTMLAGFVMAALWRIDSWQGGPVPTAVDAPTAETLGPGPLDFATTVMWISLSYSGFNAAIYVAGESTGGRSVARSMVIATTVVTAIYLTLNAIFVLAPPPQSIVGQGDVAAIAARSIGGDSLATLIRIAICIGLATSVSSILMAGPRVYAKMADDGNLPKFFAADSPPPTRSIVLQGIAIIALVMISGLQSLLSYLSLTLSLSAAATVATLAINRPGRPAAKYLGGVLASVVCPAVFVTITLSLATLTLSHDPTQAIGLVATIATGGIGYRWINRSRNQRQRNDRPSP